jgi:hypothetical protein
MDDMNGRSGVAALIKIKGPGFEPNCAAARRRLRRSGLDLTGPLNGKQAAAIMDRALKAVRSHIAGRDIERIFGSCRGFGALDLKDPVYLTLDFRQVRYVVTERIAVTNIFQG